MQESILLSDEDEDYDRYLNTRHHFADIRGEKLGNGCQCFCVHQNDFSDKGLRLPSTIPVSRSNRRLKGLDLQPGLEAAVKLSHINGMLLLWRTSSIDWERWWISPYSAHQLQTVERASLSVQSKTNLNSGLIAPIINLPLFEWTKRNGSQTRTPRAQSPRRPLQLVAVGLGKTVTALTFMVLRQNYDKLKSRD